MPVALGLREPRLEDALFLEDMLGELIVARRVARSPSAGSVNHPLDQHQWASELMNWRVLGRGVGEKSFLTSSLSLSEIAVRCGVLQSFPATKRCHAWHRAFRRRLGGSPDWYFGEGAPLASSFLRRLEVGELWHNQQASPSSSACYHLLRAGWEYLVRHPQLVMPLRLLQGFPLDFRGLGIPTESFSFDGLSSVLSESDPLFGEPDSTRRGNPEITLCEYLTLGTIALYEWLSLLGLAQEWFPGEDEVVREFAVLTSEAWSPTTEGMRTRLERLPVKMSAPFDFREHPHTALREDHVASGVDVIWRML